MLSLARPMQAVPVIVLTSLVLAAPACTKGNPAFTDSASDSAAGSTSASPTSTAPTTTSTATATDASASDSSSTGGGASEGATLAVTTTQPVEPTSTTTDPSTTTSGTTDPATTSSTGDDTTGEPPAVAALCGKTADQWQFSPPEKLPAPINAPGQDLDMWVTSDLLTFVWSSHRGDKADTYRITRPDPDSPYDPKTFANNADILLSTPKEDFKIAFSGDGSRAYRSYAAGMDGDYRIALAVRDGNNQYQPGADLQLDFDVYNDALDPHISADERRLYFAATNGDQKLAVASRPSIADPFGAPDTAIFAVVDVPGRSEADPTLSADERVVIFARNDPDAEGASNLYYALRDDPDGAFGPPQPIPGPVNTNNNEGSPHITSACELYFTRGHKTGPYDYDIFRTRLQP